MPGAGAQARPFSFYQVQGSKDGLAGSAVSEEVSGRLGSLRRDR